VPCNETAECETSFDSGSECHDGVCSSSNLFEQGCLAKMLPGWKKLRVCNSEDPPEAAELGICRTPGINYGEIRIASQNWEAAMFEA
jgi:hypothetical protein